MSNENFFNYDPNQAGGGFEPLPEAEYECIISKAEPTASKTSGAPMVKVELTVRKDVEQEGGGRKIFDNIVFSEKAMFKVHQIAGVAGVQEAHNIEDFASKLYGKAVRIKTKNEEYQGKTNPKVHFYKEAEVEGGISLPDASDDPFAGGVGINDDDLPF